MRTWPKTVKKIDLSTQSVKIDVKHAKLEFKYGPDRSVCEYRGSKLLDEVGFKTYRGSWLVRLWDLVQK